MKMKSEVIKYILFVALVSFSLNVKGQTPLTIHLAGQEEVQSTIEDFTDNVLINITNNSGQEQEVYLIIAAVGVTATGDVNIDNVATAPNNPIIVPPAGLSFNLTTLLEEYQNTSLSDFNIVPGSFIDQIAVERQLPAGTYTICMEARSVISGALVSAPGANNCLNVRVIYRDPPVIQTPLHDSWIAENEMDEVNFVWSVSDQRGDDRFAIEVIRFAGVQQANDFVEQGRPQQMFNTFERVFIAEDLTSWNFNTLSADIMPELNEGDILGVRVTAISETSVFLNNGHSEINVFIYGVRNSVACQNPSFYSAFVYPSAGDTLPFVNLFPVLKFEPVCDNLLEFAGNVQFFSTANGATTGSLGPLNYRDNWRSGPGPVNYMTNYFNTHYPGNTDYYYPSGSEYESYLPFIYDGRGFSVNRGESMYTSGNGTFVFRELISHTERSQSISLTNLVDHPTIIGMPKPILLAPQNGVTLGPENITFEFNTGEVPGNPLPPFKIFKIESNEPPVVPSLQVKEKCLLQIANDPSFNETSIVNCQLKKIQSNPYNNGDVFNEDNPVFEPFSTTFDLTPQRQFDQDHFIAETYKDISIDVGLYAEGTYYWRVVWLKNPEIVNDLHPCTAGLVISNEMIYHASEVRSFTIIDGEGDWVVKCANFYAQETDLDDPATSSSESECASPCAFPAITDHSSAGGVNSHPTFTVAGFTVEVSESTSGTSSNGTGKIIIPFLNQLKLNITFSGVQLNAARQMIAGTINPVFDSAIPLNQHISTLGRLFSMDETSGKALEATLEGSGKLISLLSSGSTASLPIGIDKEIGGAKIILGITSMTFKKDTAHMNMVVNLRIPNLEEVNGFISLGAQVCITNEGIGNDVKLYLPQDQVFDLGNGNEFRIKGAEGASSALNVTSVEWDCNGFKALNLVGAVTFTRDWLLPEDERGNIVDGRNVEARFGGRFTNGGNIMIRLDMDNFQIPGAEGWGFTPAHNIWIDLSNTENPPGIMSNLPEGYTHSAFRDEEMTNSWKGFYMEELSVKTPAQLQGPDRNRLTFAIRNMFIDNTGLSFKAKAENILRWDGEGNMNGWAASLDTVFFYMVQNDFRSFGFNGKLGLPIADRTQYLKYQAALEHRDAEFNLVISVRPAENLRIPVSMAMATIRTGSYIEVSLGAENYIEANLCATLNIGNENLSEQTMASSLSMPGIRIEHLRINSETGFDNSRFSYSLTGMDSFRGRTGSGGDAFDELEDMTHYYVVESGESTMSGFPIGLDHFSFSNDKITIQPRITLTGSEGGFSAAAKVSILINMDLMSSPQRFDVTGVQLDRIDLDITSSDVTLKGFLEFYKTDIDEGVKGGITLGLNMGVRVGVNINADFGCRKMPGAVSYNTPEWYSYFYVDGMVIISPGITLFSGVSLYGLGGGFYHHMRHDPASSLPSGGSIAAASSSSTASGVRYVPDFNNDLGLKFMIILGSNDNGQAYNLDVKLEATFSFAHGLTSLSITGSFRVMTDGISVTTVGREGKSPVAGYVNVSLLLPPGGDATLDGQFFVKLKVPFDGSEPILKGIGVIDSVPEGFTAENALVWATFHAGPDKNFFYMGTPINKCGVSLTLGGNELLSVKSYLMIGDNVPVIMPEPDPLFMEIFNRGMRPEADFTSEDGDVSELLSNSTAAQEAMGEGFAMGMTMTLNTGDISIFPFYFALRAVMGFDINVTKASPETDRRCAGTSFTPGIDGWYATGQVYAGIEGSFGILIPLFVTEIRANILEASAAMILRGGLPNPEWVSGRGSFYYNVCDGLAEGRCSFELSAGTVCEPVTGNPFAGIKIIQDISPENGASDVSVYTDISAAFSMDMNRVYEIEERASAASPPVVRRLQPYMHIFQVRKSGTTNSLLSSETSWSDNNHIYTFSPLDVLEGNTDYSVKVVARVRDNGIDMMSNGAVFYEELIHTFRTGEAPDRIVDQNLSFTYPYKNQQTFFKKETTANKGYVVCKRSNNQFLKPGDVSEFVTTFYAKFTSEDGTITTSDVTIHPGYKGVSFDVSQLENSKIYCIQIIRKDRPVSELRLPGNISIDPVGAGRLNPASNRNLQVLNFAATIGASTIASNQFKRIQLPGGQVAQFETEIYSYYFKTSQFDKMSDKLTAENPGWNKKVVRFGVELISLEKNMTEKFEYADNSSFKVTNSSNIEFGPRVTFRIKPLPNLLDGIFESEDLPVNNYLREIIAQRVMQPHSAANLLIPQIHRRLNISYSGFNFDPFYLEPIPGYTEYNKHIMIRPSSSLLAPLSASELTVAFNDDEGEAFGFLNNLNMGTMPTGQNLNLPFTADRNTSNTTIGYEPTVYGLKHYRDMRQTLLTFSMLTLNGRSGIGNVSVLLWDQLTPSEKNAINRHLLNSTINKMIREIDFTKGPQTFGIQYLYPDTAGRDVKGSIFPFTFNL